MTERTVADLLAAVVQGDHTAFDVIVDRYVRLVWSVIRSFRLDGETAKDVSQTVWTRLYVHCGKIRQPERLAGWLSTTARNECVRVLREQRRQVPTDMTDEWALGSTPASDESIVEDEMRRELLEAFAGLSATAPPAHCGRRSRLRGDRRDHRQADREHRAHEGSVPGPAAEDHGAPGRRPETKSWTRRKSKEHIVTKPQDWNDEELLSRLGVVLDDADPVPSEVVAAAKSVVPRLELEFDVDAIMAEVVFDSASDELVGVRGTREETRELTLRAPGVEIELVVLSGGGRRLVGQLVPPQTGTVELTSGDEVRTAPADNLGRFTFMDVAEGPIRLSCRLDAGGQVVQTNWLVI